MQKIYTFLWITLLALMAPVVLSAAEDFPDFYLRGQFNSWAAENAYKFSRDCDIYTLTIPSLKGEFKVGSENWRLNLGGDDSKIIDKSVVLQAVPTGQNLNADIREEVTIAFRYDPLKGFGDALLYFSLTSTPIDLPEPDPSVIIPSPDNMRTSGTLPVLYINVYQTDSEGNFIKNGDSYVYNNEVIDMNLSHKNYMKGEYWLDINGCEWLINLGAESVGSASKPLPLEIKARGNYTRTAYAKKPFKLKLGKKQNLLGLTPDKSKHYAILANADDHFGYMRNFVGFNLGERIGLPWTPSQQPIEVVINGDYRGLYFLTESIRVGDGRVPISELADNVDDPSLASGGYLVELDNYDEDNQIRMAEEACIGGHYLDLLRITWDTPEEYSPLQKRFVTDQFATMNHLIGTLNDDIWTYLDLDDAVRYYIVREIVSDVESYHGSTYLYRDFGADQKWHFSPLWDLGNAFNGHDDQFFYNCDPYGNTWIPSLRESTRFNQAIEQTWQWFMGNCYEGILNDLDAYASHIAKAAVYDHQRWKDAPTPALPVCDNSDMASRLATVKYRLDAKTHWLASQWGTPVPGMTEPTRDTTPAAPLPEYLSSGIEQITVDTNTPAEYFDIFGRRVSNPTPGNLYILRAGSTILKTVVK